MICNLELMPCDLKLDDFNIYACACDLKLDYQNTVEIIWFFS